MRAKLILLALMTIIGGAAAHGAPVRVAFTGTLTHFDAGYETIMGPGERVHGEYTIPSPHDRHATQFFGVTMTSTWLSTFSILGESGWQVTTNEGLLSQQSGLLAAGSHNNPLLNTGYRYSALGGEVSGQSSMVGYLDPNDVILSGEGIADDINRNGLFGPDYIGIDSPGFIPIPSDLPDIVVLPTLGPTVWSPIIEFTITGPSDWGNSYGQSPDPPPLSGATSAIIKLNIDIFVPLVGLQRRTATFEITSVHVVPEPGAAGIGMMALAGWGMRRSGARRSRSDGC